MNTASAHTTTVAWPRSIGDAAAHASPVVRSAHLGIDKVSNVPSRLPALAPTRLPASMMLVGPVLLLVLWELDELLLPYTIDLSIFATLDHPALREHIERVGVVFYARGVTTSP